MKTYKLLRFIEPETSIPVGDIFQAEGLVNLDNWNTIPADWLIEHWYIEEVKERPTSWEELWEIKWYFIGMDSDIGKTDGIFYSADSNKNIFLTKQQCEASLALAQISQLLDKYDIPEKSDIRYYKNCTSWNPTWIDRCWLLRFDTPEKRDHFYKHHSDLISKLAPFYIF